MSSQATSLASPRVPTEPSSVTGRTAAALPASSSARSVKTMPAAIEAPCTRWNGTNRRDSSSAREISVTMPLPPATRRALRTPSGTVHPFPAGPRRSVAVPSGSPASRSVPSPRMRNANSTSPLSGSACE